jgi:hypothetical protein
VRRSFSIAPFLLIAHLVVGATYGISQTPRDVVRRYCSLDAQGANFSASNPNAQAILGLLVNEDEAGYDQSVIIKSYTIRRSRVSDKKAEFEVIYSSLGAVSSELATERNPHTEAVVFHLKLVDNSWKIDGLRILPHISKTWMLAYLRRNLRDAEQAKQSDPETKAAIAEIATW